MNLKEQINNTFALCSSNNCLEDICFSAFEIIDDQPTTPCRLLIDGQSDHFRIENPRKHLLHFLKIDHCILFEQDGRKCDFAVFNADELIFVELKNIEENTSNNSRKRGGKRREAYDQLKNTLKIFENKNINLSNYQNNQKLFVIASVLDYNPPIVRIPVGRVASMDAQLKFEEYHAILLSGHTYKFIPIIIDRSKDIYMNIRTLYCKLHFALCTESRLDYMGSVTIDQDWMDEAGLQDGQAVDVLNIDNGARLTTYAIPGKRGLGEICLNGAAAHHFEPGHRVIIIVYCDLTLDEKTRFQPKILMFNDHPPFEVDHGKKKLRWLEGRPTYSLLQRETSATTYNTALHKESDSEQLLANNWRLGCQLLWDEEELVAGFSAFMRENHVERVLDVSGGNGFPTIELRRKGWNIAYNDANSVMKAQVEAQIKDDADFVASMPCTQVSWEQLDSVIVPDSYDMIMCRGNSLPYAASWSVNKICEPEQTKAILQKALAQFFKALRPGGVLLVDKSSFESTGIHVIQKEGEVDGQSCRIHWVFVIDLESGIRRWDQYNLVGRKTTCLTVYSLLITEKMLLDWLATAGFVSVCQTPIRGENVYTVFTARKPAGETTVAKTSDYYDHQNAIYREVWDTNGRICWGYYPPDEPEPKFEEAGQKHVERMASMIHLDLNAKVLEVGCGNGVTAIWLAQRFDCQVVGLDPSETNIKIATELACKAGVINRVTFVCTTIQEAVFENSQFTHIWSNAALSHIPEKERKETFAEMYRILCSEGILLFDDSTSPTGEVDAHAREWVYERLHYDKLYTPTEYVELLESSGFDVEKVDDLTQHQKKSYEVLSQRAQTAGYSRLAKAYLESSKASNLGTLGWAIFLAKRHSS